MTEQGFGKRTDVADFPIKHRATGGVIANSLNEDTDVAAVRLVGQEDEEVLLGSPSGGHDPVRWSPGGPCEPRPAGLPRRHGQ